MRRIAAALVLVAVASGLAGCSSPSAPSSLAYGDGYAAGESLAAGVASIGMTATAAHARCVGAWRRSALVSEREGPWVDGCVAGYLVVVGGVSPTTL